MTKLTDMVGALRDSTKVIGTGIVRDLRRTPAKTADSGVPRTEFDPTTPESIADPYSALARLRENPVTVNEKLDVWMIARHNDVLAATRAHHTLSSSSGILLRSTPMPGVVSTDEPDHARLRRITAPAFAPTAVRRFADTLREFAAPGIDALRAGEVVDMVPALTVPLPVSAIALLLGIDRSRWSDFHKYSADFTALFAVRSITEVAMTTWRALPGILTIRELIADEFDRRATEPADDVIGRVKTAMDSGDMSALEALVAVLILLIAGAETTTNLLGILLVQLARNPELYERLRADRSLIPAATEEALRWGAPVQWVARTTLAPYEIADTVIPPRSRVVLFYAGANRDPDRFTRPDEFDIDRSESGHVTFGHGTHFCMGVHLARLEVRIALERLLDTAEAIGLAGPVRWTRTPSLSGPVSVPLKIVRR
ncbi:cytochrome P450 [Nocardia barduliensis]|uniref:cytochrome P450 n=1 Tax=Nocardia barduliensis TaxID=2736643 RepID=UPI001574E735|nr:cytochrome P450 [Nocardia barduliensis]